MIETLRGIVLDRIKHTDKTEIVSIYTLERGRVPFAVRFAATPRGRALRARLMPLSVVEVSVNFKNSQELQRLGEVASITRFPDIYADPSKQAVAFFLREFLGRLLRDFPRDPAMWKYIVEGLSVLDAANRRGTANFPIIFLSGMTRILGIAPDTGPWRGSRGEANTDGLHFDLRSASYHRGLPLHSDCLIGDEARIPALLGRISYFHGAYIPLSRASRRAIFAGLLRYYAIHTPGLADLRTPDILATLF